VRFQARTNHRAPDPFRGGGFAAELAFVFRVEGRVTEGRTTRETIQMGEHIDEAKGRAKEAADDLTDDES
jgi:hypothetical protein